MKKIAIILGCAVILAGTMMSQGMAKGAFDQWGYNYQALLFNGLFGNADENRPGDGNPDTYLWKTTDEYSFYDADGNYHKVLINVKGSKLVMKWSKVWHMAVFGPDNVRYNGDEQPWGPGAWCTNHVVGTGTIYNTNGTPLYEGKMTILSKISWVGDTTGYMNPIWGQMAVTLKVVSAQGVHLGFHETPAGFGAVP